MHKKIESKPKLLIGDYQSLDNISEKIAYSNYSCMDTVVPMQRCRGTIINVDQENRDKVHIIGWQRDMTRIRKMDVSLPFIVKMTLTEGIITSIGLDQSFNGGKGILCSNSYLEKNLQELLLGHPIDKKFLSKAKLDYIHCFHIYEVLNSIYSSYLTLNKIGSSDTNKTGVFYEEEVSDCSAIDGDLYVYSRYKLEGKETLDYMLVFNDIFNKVAFSTDGYMRIIEEIEVEFYINGSLKQRDYIKQYENDYMFINLQKFLIKCVHDFKSVLYDGYKIRILNTNLTPGAMVGILIQAINMRVFKDNFNYIQHIFTALQRPGKTPKCLGGILTREEAKKYFPKFNYENLY